VFGKFRATAPRPASAAARDTTSAASPDRDPIWAAILDAPLAEEPETERAAFDDLRVRSLRILQD
jgi:hypothetical protein